MKRSQRLLWVAFGAVMIALVGIALQRQFAVPPLPVLGTLGPFQLTNQLGAAVSPEQLQGSVVIANVIFSRCPGQCHRLSVQMARIQKATGDGIRLISLTADPEFDAPAVLKEYGSRYGALPERWWFLTGPKAEVYRVAEKDLLFTVLDTGEVSPRLDDRFIHSGNYVLLDRSGRIRSVVQSEEPGSESRVLELAERLRRESWP